MDAFLPQSAPGVVQEGRVLVNRSFVMNDFFLHFNLLLWAIIVLMFQSLDIIKVLILHINNIRYFVIIIIIIIIIYGLQLLVLHMHYQFDALMIYAKKGSNLIYDVYTTPGFVTDVFGKRTRQGEIFLKACKMCCEG